MAKTANNKVEKIDLTGVKEELKDYVDISIKKSMKDELEKSSKRLIREKNKKILIRNIVILILIVIIGFLLFLMYKNKVFNRYLGCEVPTNVTTQKQTVNIIDKEEEKEASLEDLISEFSFLLNKVVIHENSSYINDYYSGNLSNELKNYLAFNNLDINTLGEEENYNLFDSSLLRNEYNKLFDTDYEPTSFNYLDERVRYLNKMDSYITDRLLDSSVSNIKREIIDVNAVDDTVIITCVEGVVKDSHLYNVLSKKEVEYTKGSLADYEKSLTKITYTFVKGKLNSIK